MKISKTSIIHRLCGRLCHRLYGTRIIVLTSNVLFLYWTYSLYHRASPINLSEIVMQVHVHNVFLGCILFCIDQVLEIPACQIKKKIKRTIIIIIIFFYSGINKILLVQISTMLNFLSDCNTCLEHLITASKIFLFVFLIECFFKWLNMSYILFSKGFHIICF